MSRAQVNNAKQATSSSKVVTSSKATTSSSNWKDRLTTEDYEELRNTFDVFDEDHSGTIDPVEINKVLEELGVDRRNPLVLNIILRLKDINKPIRFE